MPSDSRSSAVAGTSSSDFTPDETTSAGVRASCARSALTSGGSGKPRCTPPSPPVAIQRIPTACATASVPPTVVAPTALCATATARSRGPSLRALASKRWSSASVRPTTISPSSTPIVAGTAPAARTCRSDSSPTSTPSPGGKPCATNVVSSATARGSASRTSSATRITRRRLVPLRLDRLAGGRQDVPDADVALPVDVARFLVGRAAVTDLPVVERAVLVRHLHPTVVARRRSEQALLRRAGGLRRTGGEQRHPVLAAVIRR